MNHRNTSVDEAEWTTRVRNCFRNNDIKTLGEILKIGESAMLRMPNLGRKGINEIKATLADYGLYLTVYGEKNVVVEDAPSPALQFRLDRIEATLARIESFLDLSKVRLTLQVESREQ